MSASSCHLFAPIIILFSKHIFGTFIDNRAYGQHWKSQKGLFSIFIFPIFIAINQLWCIFVQCGWYWGSISGKAAEKVLSCEPNGSFILRDSSNDHYIFSLTCKLNNCVHHIRIAYDIDRSTFLLGQFETRTIMQWIENVVEIARSER